jgi:putative membrane protein insertion efficiency factor
MAEASMNGAFVRSAAVQSEQSEQRKPAVVVPTTRLGRVVAAPIVAYRRWISPALPPTCRYYPSCSEYALTAIAVHGPVRGIGLAIRRLLRCHPFHPGGIDHVPPRTPSPDATHLEH